MKGLSYIHNIILSALLVTLIVVHTGCEDESAVKTQKELLDELEAGYMGDISDLGIAELHEEMKWRMYCNHCDVPVQDCRGMEVDGLTYGMLALKVFHVSYNYDTDTGEVAYTFVYRDSIQCSIDGGLPQNSVHGFGFTRNGKEPLYFISAGYTNKISVRCDTLEDITECPTRMINPRQPAIKKFLLRNRGHLNPWFHMQAVKRGVINED